jgi:hypothetical protein
MISLTFSVTFWGVNLGKANASYAPLCGQCTSFYLSFTKPTGQGFYLGPQADGSVLSGSLNAFYFLNPANWGETCVPLRGENSSGVTVFLKIDSQQAKWSVDPNNLPCWELFHSFYILNPSTGRYFNHVFLCDRVSDLCINNDYTLITKANLSAYLANCSQGETAWTCNGTANNANQGLTLDCGAN